MSMTESEAIRRLKDHFRVHDDGRPTPYLDEAVSMAISALEEVQQYRAIGTVEELKTLHNDYWKLNEICKEYSAIGTVSEFRELKEKATAIKSDGFSDHLLNMGYTKGIKDGYAKAIEEFAEKMKELFKHIKVADSVIDMVVKEMKGER